MRLQTKFSVNRSRHCRDTAICVFPRWRLHGNVKNN